MTDFLPEVIPSGFGPATQADLLRYCLQNRVMPDRSPLYPHAPDDDALTRYWTKLGLWYAQKTGYAYFLPLPDERVGGINDSSLPYVTDLYANGSRVDRPRECT